MPKDNTKEQSQPKKAEFRCCIESALDFVTFARNTAGGRQNEEALYKIEKLLYDLYYSSKKEPKNA